jgi:ABC-type multidrug transport system fused ATPase/permease subunit
MDKKLPEFSWWDLIRAFWFFAEGNRVKLALWISLLFVVYFYQFVPPYILGKIVDFFINFKQDQSLQPFYIYVILLGALTGLAAVVRLTSKNKVTLIGIHAVYIVKTKGFERLLDFSLKWHDSENTGNKAQRIQTGASALMQGSRMLQNTLIDVITSLIGVTVIFLFLNHFYSLFIIIYITIFLIIQRYFYNKMMILNNQKYKALEQSSGAFYEGVNNVLTIKTLGVQTSFKKTITDKEFVSKDFSSKLSSLGNKKWKVFQILNSVAMIAFLLLIGNSVVTKAVSIGMILVLYNYFQKLIEAAASSMDLFNDLIDIKSGVGRMMPIYWQEDINYFGDKIFPNTFENLKITKASFTYKSEVVGLKDINIEINRNQKIGVVGRSGSGKSTLAKILMGLYKLESGEFRINDLDFYSFKHSEVTKNMALVLQDSEMFNLSLKENITLLKNIDSKLFATALEISQLEELIEKLPEGLETLIGEKGYRLSGGERQRVGLARAICKNPQILILDEATSSLDTRTESLIQEGLEKYLEAKTMIIIAHRVSTLKNVDRILVFDAGEIIEQGSFDQLLKNKESKFNQIYTMQNRSK